MTTELSDNTNPASDTTGQSAFKTLAGMFYEPARSFAAIKQKSMLVLPLVLPIVGTAILLLWYYNQVDIAWLQDKLLAGKELEPAQREAALKFMTRSMMQNLGLAGAVLAPPIMYALMALYFLIVAKVVDVPVTFGKWFAMTAWAGVPGLISIVLGFVQILLADHGQLAPNQLNPLSVNQLFFHLEIGTPWSGVLDGINVTTIWSIVLLAIGFQSWTGKSRFSSFLIAAAPAIVILAISALFQGK